jgi:putative tryptophan/tyrosine transport system substrate-binding protein
MAIHIRRREFIFTLGGAAAAWPIAARSQQARPTIGFLGAGTPSTHGQWLAAFVQRLRELGWIEGRTVTIESRWAEGRDARFAEIAAEFVRMKVDVIVSPGAALLPAKQATSTIPIVFPVAGNPVGSGLVASLARPGGNITGFRSNRPMWLASASTSCARLSPVSAGWRSWPMSADRVLRSK